MAFFSTFEMRRENLLKLVLIVWGLNSTCGYIQRQHGLQTNQVIQDNDWEVTLKDSHLPECQQHSVCSYVQVNARGTSTRHYCRCPGPTSCPSIWDSLDGHSITQGADQYKFCERAPEVLPCTNRQEIAYTSTMAFAKVTGDLLTTTEHVHCYCPELHTYETVDTAITDLNDRVEIMKVKYSCIPLNTCRLSEPCKAVSDTIENYFVHPKCLCPNDESCPTLTNHVLETISMGKGTVQLLGCHKK